eukprot:UN25443
MLEEKAPSPENCVPLVKHICNDRRDFKRRKPEWYKTMINQPGIATLYFGGEPERWEKYSIVKRPVTGRDTEKENQIVIQTRGMKRFMQLLNCDYVQLNMTIEITSGNGHILADPLHLVDQSDKSVYIPPAKCTRRVKLPDTQDFDSSQTFYKLSVML